MLAVVFAAPAKSYAAEAAVNLGTTGTFAVLAGSTITSTGATAISGSAGGDVGLSPGSAVIGFPPATISDGLMHTADAIAIQAKADLVTAYNDAAGRTTTTDLTGQALGGITLTAGVYSFDTSAQLTGTLTLDGQGDPEAVFIFKIGSTLTTASGSLVNLINGARYCRVFWQVGTSATLGTTSTFAGHILAMESITATTGAMVQGQLLARNGAVTLDTNIIINGVCEVVPTPTTTAAPTTTVLPTTTIVTATTVTPTTTTPGGQLPNTATPWYTILIAGAGLLLIGALVFKSRKINE